jgi:iron complex transport system ATP-binding protein
MSFFSVNGLCAGYQKGHVFDDISFALPCGSLMGILGANGSGKTTLLKAICGILPHEGTCLLDGTELEGVSARNIARLCSYIPQRSGISIDISVMDVVLMGFNPWLGLLERPNARIREAACRALAQVGLTGREEENYLHLSEGQKQLCILARTLVTQSKLLLLDEPESALDFRYRYRMLQILRGWVREKQIGAIATLHDPSLALNYCDQILILHEGKLLGCIFPKKDPLNHMEAMLSRVYGPVSLERIMTRSGQAQLVMLKEEDL